jgi:hypothetical protein
VICHDEETQNWLSSNVSSLKVWEGSRLKSVGLEALSSYKRGVAWFSGPAEDTERYFQRLHRLNQGLNTSQWRVHERKEEPTWPPTSGLGQLKFSLLGVKLEARKAGRHEGRKRKQRRRPNLTW